MRTYAKETSSRSCRASTRVPRQDPRGAHRQGPGAHRGRQHGQAPHQAGRDQKVPQGGIVEKFGTIHISNVLRSIRRATSRPASAPRRSRTVARCVWPARAARSWIGAEPPPSRGARKAMAKEDKKKDKKGKKDSAFAVVDKQKKSAVPPRLRERYKARSRRR